MDGGEIPEEEFAGHLRSLGVETGGLSFGWMLNEYDSEGILRWMFTHLDSGNALTKREACRYAELKESGLLSEEELVATISEIQEEYKGLTLPGDAEGLERVKREKAFLEERLQMLNKQERTVNTLVKQNELAKEEVTRQVSELKEQQARALAELETAKQDSMSAAEAATKREEELFRAVSKHVNVYFTSQGEGQQFMTSGPLEVYTQKKRLFKSHLKMRVAQQLDMKRWKDNLDMDGNYQDNAAAKQAEERLFKGIMRYVLAVADYYRAYNVVQFMSAPPDIHPSRIHTMTAETQNNLELLKQQEELTLEELRTTAQELVKQQTRRAETARARAALQQRREIYSIISSIHESVAEYESLDALLYLVLRREWRRAQETIQFAEDVKEYFQAERNNLAARVDAMNSLYQEHTECEKRLQSGNLLADTLNQLYGEQTEDGFLHKGAAIESRKTQLKEEIDAEFQRKEQFLEDMAVKCQPLLESIWDGCTRRPGVYDRTLTRLQQQLSMQAAAVDAKVTRAVDTFTNVKAKNKDNVRKLWQWFLTDPERLIAKIDELQRKQ